MSAANVCEVGGSGGHSSAAAESAAPLPGSTASSSGVAAATASPQHLYYPLGTEQRYRMDETLRVLRCRRLNAEKEHQFAKQHPFRPSTYSSSPSGMQSNRNHWCGSDRAEVVEVEETTATATMTQQPNTTGVFDRLAAQATQLELRRRHREEAKRRAEAAALQHAFQPQINKDMGGLHAEKLQHHLQVPVEERLLHYGESVSRERQRRQEAKQREEAALWAAKDQHSTLLRTEDRQRARDAFEQRTELFLMEKERRRDAAVEAAEQQHSFHPSISATSAALDAERQRFELQCSSDSMTRNALINGRRGEELYARAVARQRDKGTGPSESARDSILSDGTAAADQHHPSINPLSEAWIASGAHRDLFAQSFVRRQQLYEEARREEESLKARAADGVAPPQPRRVDPNQLSERLYYKAREARETAAERRREAESNAVDCLFHPQVSPGTASVLRQLKGRETDVVKRLTTGRQTLKNSNEELYEPAPSSQTMKSSTCRRSIPQSPSSRHCKEKKIESPFTASSAAASPSSPSPQQQQRVPPKVQKVSASSVAAFYERQLAALQETQDVIQQRRQKDLLQEMTHCTFRPQTNPPRRCSSGADDDDGSTSKTVHRVTGVSGFLERQSLARQKKAELETLVQNMGRPSTALHCSEASPTSSPTVVVPFQLLTNARPNRSYASYEERDKRDTYRQTNRTNAPPPVASLATLSTVERDLFHDIEEEAVLKYTAPVTGASVVPLHRGHVASCRGGYMAALGIIDEEEESLEPQVSASPHGANVSLFSQMASSAAAAASKPSARKDHPMREKSADQNKRTNGAPAAMTSAMKRHDATISSSTKRRKQSRSVSFLDASESSPPAKPIQASHARFLMGDI